MTGISGCQIGTNKKGPFRGPSRCVKTRVGLADGPYVRRLGALLPLCSLELDLRTLGQGLEALAADAAVVDEQILRSVIGGDEAVPLLVAEPLHGSGCQLIHLPLLPPRTASAAARVNELRPRASHSRAFKLLFVPEACRDAAYICLLVG